MFQVIANNFTAKIPYGSENPSTVLSVHNIQGTFLSLTKKGHFYHFKKINWKGSKPRKWGAGKEKAPYQSRGRCMGSNSRIFTWSPTTMENKPASSLPVQSSHSWTEPNPLTKKMNRTEPSFTARRLLFSIDPFRNRDPHSISARRHSYFHSVWWKIVATDISISRTKLISTFIGGRNGGSARWIGEGQNDLSNLRRLRFLERSDSIHSLPFYLSVEHANFNGIIVFVV